MKLQNSYTWIKGINYVPSYAQNDIEFWRDYDKNTVKKEILYAKRLGLNVIRPFLSYVVYLDNRKQFLDNVLHLVKTAFDNGIYTIPTVWDSCFSEDEPNINCSENKWFANPGAMYLTPECWDDQKAYVLDLIKTLSDEPGLLMWDVHNEPTVTNYISNYQGKELEEHKRIIWAFVKHYCEYFRKNDKNPITVGVSEVSQFEEIKDYCDVLSFHNYSPTVKEIEMEFDKANHIAKESNKLVFCSEMGCTGRANPYDLCIEVANNKNMGYILWELMIGKSFWNDRHGIVYPDGTVRDASIISALQGFFRNRDAKSTVRTHLNCEGLVDRILKEAQEWIDNPMENTDKGDYILEVMANLLEGGEITSFAVLPTVKCKLVCEKGMESIKEQMKDWYKILKADKELKLH